MLHSAAVEQLREVVEDLERMNPEQTELARHQTLHARRKRTDGRTYSTRRTVLHRQKCGGLARILPRSALASAGQMPPHTEDACSLCSLHLFRHTTLAMDIRHDMRHD
jgi:hypothetical protein